jgi:hypothetical protein
MKRTLRFVILFLLPAALLLSQSLVEVSKKEQERREKLKGKNVKVITNADLKSVKRTPAVTTQAEPSAGAETAEPRDKNNPDVRAAERHYDTGGGSPFATAVLPDTILVVNPEYALDFPDGRYAEISIFGILDLEINARNGPGDDIAIYANRPGTIEGMPESPDEGLPTASEEAMWIHDKMAYGVMVMRDQGEWEELGVGTGEKPPDKFDLGSIPSIKKIRIMFRLYTIPTLQTKPLKQHPGEFTMGVDAVEALH